MQQRTFSRDEISTKAGIPRIHAVAAAAAAAAASAAAVVAAAAAAAGAGAAAAGGRSLRGDFRNPCCISKLVLSILSVLFIGWSYVSTGTVGYSNPTALHVVVATITVQLRCSK